MDDRYPNLVLDEKFKDIKASLDRIEQQTIKTNGSVASLKIWRAYTTGALAVLSFLIIGIGIPIVVAILGK